MTRPMITVFRAAPQAGLGPTIHIVGSRLNGFALSSPCGTILAAVNAEQRSADRKTLETGDQAQLEARHYCRHCLNGLRANPGVQYGDDVTMTTTIGVTPR